MQRSTPHILKTFAVVAMMVGLTGVRCLGESAAKLAPADTGVFIELNDLARHRAAWKDSPIADVLGEMKNNDVAKVWREVQTVMGMPGDELFDTYFGAQVALIGERPGDNEPNIILTRIKKDDGLRVIERLSLIRQGKFGDFTVYRSDDDKALLGFSDQWMALAGTEHQDYCTRVLKARAAGSLASDKTFKQWTAKLPAKRGGTVFVRDRNVSEIHSLAVTNENRVYSLIYRGSSPKFDEIYKQLDASLPLDFSPLPDDYLLAVTANVFDRKDAKGLAGLDHLIAPRTFAKDVLPNIGAPVAIAVGSPQMIESGDRTLAGVPPMVLAVHLKDHAAAEDLDRVFDYLVRLSNVLMLDWDVDVDPVVARKVSHKTHEYRSANFGPALVKGMGRDELTGLALCFGRIDDWYVVANSDSYYKACAASRVARAARVNELKQSHTPILRIHLRPTKGVGDLSQLINQLPDIANAPLQPKQAMILERFMTVCKTFDDVNFQMAKESDGTMTGRLDLSRTK